MLRNILIIVLGLAFLYALFTVGAPFLLALLFAIFLEPLNAILIRYLKMNRIAAATITSTALVAAMLGAIYLLIAKIVSELIALVRNLDFNELNMFVLQALDRLDALTVDMPPDVAANIRVYAMSQIQSLQGLATQLSGYTFDVLRTLPGLLIFFLVFFVALYLFSFSLATIQQSFLSFFEEKSRDKIAEVLLNLRSAVFGFIRAQFMLSGLTFLIAFAGLLILDVRYALAISFLIVLVDILPVLGTGSVLVPWAAYSFFIGDPRLAIGLVVLFVLITVFRRIVEPKILGEQIGIGALPTLISLYVGYELIGAIGLILGPIVVIIYQAMVKVGLLKIKIRLE
ncbi:sporulation integral membrane protein YtvI [Paenibacillus sp.]|uniref:sporulation integral membrane protein YtvI n=1 Tax=Paenibacillus sp. TaxID=58172 RepID=UPI002D2AD16A|nr:sporulation integral membrane protein YtvI [Paenibacillus sp.]HZG58461.1 sporulation integral membrane protein YtvI [Paenibacillus sp.]